jgi:hypothetical protein
MDAPPDGRVGIAERYFDLVDFSGACRSSRHFQYPRPCRGDIIPSFSAAVLMVLKRGGKARMLLPS